MLQDEFQLGYRGVRVDLYYPITGDRLDCELHNCFRAASRLGFLVEPMTPMTNQLRGTSFV